MMVGEFGLESNVGNDGLIANILISEMRQNSNS